MEIDVAGLSSGLTMLAIGIALMGYFIGKGLHNLGQPEKGRNYHYFIKENELEFYLNLSKIEIEELLRKYPDAPRLELNGKKYYPQKQFMEWLSSHQPYVREQ